MGRVCFYSDDSYNGIAAKRFNFVVAGIALDAVKSEVETLLLGAEARSGKEERDWHSTKDPTIRREYIEELLRTHHLVGRVFYGAWASLETSGFWDARACVIGDAIARYSHRGRCYHEVAHEGLKMASRQQLRGDLKRRGVKRVTVEPGLVAADPQIRCADALAGYIRCKLFDTGVTPLVLPPLPDWIVDLSPVQTKAL